MAARKLKKNGKDITTIAELRRFLLRRIREDGKDYDTVAEELRKSGIQLGKGDITGFRVLSLCKGLAVHRRRGPKPSSARRVWREEVEPHLEKMSAEQLAAFYTMEVAPAAKRAKRNGTLARFARQPANVNYEGMIDDESGEAFC
jgi:hypothetical protein